MVSILKVFIECPSKNKRLHFQFLYSGSENTMEILHAIALSTEQNPFDEEEEEEEMLRRAIAMSLLQGED